MRICPTTQPVSTCITWRPVTGGDSYLVYSNSTGYEPFYGTEYSDAMDDVFGADWTLDYYETMDPFEVFNPATCFIYMQGGGNHASEMQDFLDDNQNLVEAWVEAGGNLIMNASSTEITFGDTLHLGFDNTGLYSYSYTSDATAVDDTHPIFTGPFTPAGSEYSGYYISYNYLTGGDFTPLLEDTYTPGHYLMGEQDWGAGHVLFAALYYPDYWTTWEEGENMHRNMLEYMKECETGADLKVTDILSPDGGCGMTATETVTVEIENLSGTPVTGLPVKFSVDGGAEVSETVAATIDAFSTYEYTFTATADLSVAGDHTIEAWTDYGADLDPSNDLHSVTITSLETPSVDLGPNGTQCDEVTLDAGNAGSVYSWSTGATTQEIVVTSSGTYSVTVTNPTSGCAATDDVTLTINYTPSASFTYTAVGLSVTFTNTSTGGATYSWNFGDGGTSTETNPNHVYGTEGVYTVTVTVTNGCGSDFYSAVISVSTGIEELALANATQIYPNPTSGKAVVDFNLDGFYNVSMQLVNSLGQTVWESNPGSIMNSKMEIDLSGLADGIYNMQITADDYTFSKPLVITKD
ncbi:MAG: PKD domain-containing protein [Bacteroidetes bacterium]|nr:PKD domain-containing protein [Bacteroidota bacterium]